MNFQHGGIPRSAAEGHYTKLVVGPKTGCGGPMLPFTPEGGCYTCGEVLNTITLPRSRHSTLWLWSARGRKPGRRVA